MDDEKTPLGVRHVQVRLTEEEHAKLSDQARQAGLKLQPYLRHLISAAPDAQHQYVKHSRQHAMLEYVLEHDKQAGDWITGNLHMFVEAIRSRRELPRKAARSG